MLQFPSVQAQTPVKSLLRGREGKEN